MCTSEASSANTPDPGLPPDSRAALVRHIEKLEELTRNAHQNPQLSQQRIDLIQTILNQPAVDQVHDLRAALLHDLGRAYSELPAQDRTPNLECAIRCYREALDLRQGQETTKYADTQRNLGDAYAELTTGDRGANLQKAIDCYQRSLAVFTMESSPQDYALIQNQLGIAYAELPTDDAQSSLQQAIHCFREALRFYPPEQAAEAYADVQNNLGIVYSRLHIGDRAENLQRAIACYEEALRFRLSKSDSLAYALTQINLGNAYAELSVSRAMNLRRAITCYQEALENCPATEHPYLYAMIQDNLGSAYSDLPDGNRAKNLRKAIDYYEHALHFRTPTAFPHDYAMTQNNLGVAYCDLTTGDRLANLRHATDCLQQALTIYTREETPLDYAMTQNNLGTAYAELAKLGVPSGWEQALTCYRQALRIYALETFPADHLMSAYNLGKLHFEQRHWCKAHSAYQMAIAADGRLYQTAVTETSRLSEAAEAANLYRNDAYCLARLGRYAEAVECLEAGRARVLADALKRGHALLDRAPSRDRDEFRAIIARIRSLEAQAHEMMGMGRSKGKASGFVEITKQRRTLRARLTRVVERVRARFPEFMPSALDMRAIASAVPPGRPLVFLVTSSEGSMALIVPPAMDRLDEQHVVWMDSFAEDRLDYVLHHYQVGAGLSRDLSPQTENRFGIWLPSRCPSWGSICCIPWQFGYKLSVTPDAYWSLAVRCPCYPCTQPASQTVVT
jgi:tetratricopeptide (TPR) repeat protein